MTEKNCENCYYGDNEFIWCNLHNQVYSINGCDDWREIEDD